MSRHGRIERINKMYVNGFVKISLSLSVYDLDTDAVYVDKYGNIKISDDEQFFIDWSDRWENGTGELIGASALTVELEREDEDEDEDEEKEIEED